MTWAWRIAEAELATSLPRRWAHSQGVAARAAQLAGAAEDVAPLLAAAAVLHDVGYAPQLVVTGFHPLDGARFLREELAAEFPLLEDQFLVDALVYCDMTTTPDGELTTARERVMEIVGRYGVDSIVGRFIRRAAPEIFAAVERVEEALAEGQPR